MNSLLRRQFQSSIENLYGITFIKLCILVLNIYSEYGIQLILKKITDLSFQVGCNHFP